MTQNTESIASPQPLASHTVQAPSEGVHSAAEGYSVTLPSGAVVRGSRSNDGKAFCIATSFNGREVREAFSHEAFANLVAMYCALYGAEKPSASPAAPAGWRATDAQIAAWAERYDLRESSSELRTMFEDARTVHLLEQ